MTIGGISANAFTTRREVTVMKFALLFLSVSLALTVGAWGSGHNDVARLCSEFMPQEIKSALGEWNDRLEWWCHYPDMTEVGWGGRRFMTVEDMRREIGDGAEVFQRWGFAKGDWLHRHRGRAVTLAQLKEAFRIGDWKRAAFCYSVLGHAVADQGAINHTPILQFTTYSRFAGVDYGWKHECEFSLRNKAVAERIRARLKDYRPRLLASTFGEANLLAVMDCYRQSEVAANEEIRAAFGSKSQHDEAMARIVVAQMESLLDMVWTAWCLRDEPFELTEDYLKGISAREEVRRRETDPVPQAVYHDLFDATKNPVQPKATIGFVFEPYGSFHVKALSYVGKMLGAAYARTLRDAGYAVQGISFWGLETTDLPKPSAVSAIVLFPGRSSGFTKPMVENLQRYRAAGGRLIVIGGRDPHDISGMRDVFVEHTDEEVPVSSKWAIQNEGIWQKMSISFVPAFGDLGTNPYSFVRNPNFDGFCKPECKIEVKIVDGVTPLAYLDNGTSRFCVAARRGGVTWLPEYLLLPFLFSADTSVDWADMRLDTFASRVGLAAISISVGAGAGNPVVL